MKRIYALLTSYSKYVLSALIGILFFINSNAQIINEGFEEPGWLTINGSSGQVIINTPATTSTMTYVTAPGVGNSTTALNTNPNSGTWWYSKAQSNTVAATYTKLDKVHSVSNSVKMASSAYIITPITSSAIVGVTFWAQLNSTLTIGLATDPNIAQPSYSSCYAEPAGFGNFSTSFPANGVMTSYSIAFTGVTSPVRVGFFNFGGSSGYIDDIIVYQPTGTKPTVQTTTIVPGITDAMASGLVTPGTLPLLASGIIWSKTPLTGNAADTALSKTYDVPSSKTSFTDKISPLTPGTTYYEEAYVIALDNTVYFGVPKTFTTKPLGVPLVGLTLTSIGSNKAGATGSIIDSGGQVISERGFLYTTTNNSPTLTSNSGKIYEGSGTLSFSDFVKGLKPNTHYCVAAYAINKSGPGYSQDTCFTTGPLAPALTAIPGSLDFGSEFFNSSAIILNYTLTGVDLSGGPITITAPAGFIIATSPNTFGTTTGNTLTLTAANTPTYAGNTLNSTPIYVEMPTTAYATYTGSNIIHSGGGVAPADADMVTLTGNIIPSPVDVANSGSDFYLGFGYEEKMSRDAGDANECRLSVYVTTGSQPATVHVVLNSGGYTQTQTIPANSYYAFTNFPTGDPNSNTDAAGLPDARLYSTGISNKSIHVYSDNGVPVSVFMHSYTQGNSAAGAMIFPTNTWNSSYTVQAFGGTSNNSNPNSFFFVIAEQDNTVVTFTPTQPILDASPTSLFNENAGDPVLYNANTTYTITLNKGQVFNAMGSFNPTGNGLDLSGTKVSTTCDKKITVFGGNGRCLVDGIGCTQNSGSDHLIQQMFPSVAWGTKYLTAPTNSETTNYFRIYIQDPATVVKVNGAPIASALQKGVYYEYQTNQPAEITSDRPINVCQFMLTPACIPGATDGGPEMIILSPIEQAISNVTFYSPTSGKVIITGAGGGYTSYMNVIIPTSKANTFKLDGIAPVAGSFKVHPADPQYSYAQLTVTSKSLHKLTADTGFVAIAYGLGDGESYGFNAGTQVKNLRSVQFTDNPYGRDSSATAVRTCVGNAVKLKLALPFNPTQVSKITWNPQQDPRISPNDSIAGPMNGASAKYDSVIQVEGRTFYVYTSPVAYTFSQNGIYRFPVQIYGTFASDCPGEDIENMLIIVGHDQTNLTFTSSCGNPVVTFNTDTIPMAGTHIVKTIFDFGDGPSANNPQINGVINPITHTYPSNKVYTAKFTTYNTVGCISTDSLLVDFSGGLKAGFSKDINSVCQGGSITFTDNSVASGVSGNPNKWTWDFGDGTAAVVENGTSVPQSHLYNKTGKLAVKLTVNTDAGCADTFTDSVLVEPTPVADFSAPEACFGTATTFTDKSNVPGGLGTVDSSFFDFGDGTKHDSSFAPTIVHTYTQPGTYTVKLYAKSDGGCISPTVSHTVVVDALPVAGFKIDVDCVNDLITFTDTSNAMGGTITEWDWDFTGDGITDSVTHTAGISFKHPYPNGNGQTFTVGLTVKTQTGCTNTAPTQSFGIGAAPTVSFSIAPGTLCLPSANVTFINNSTITDGTTNQMSYIWNFGENPDGTPGTGGGDSVVAAGPPAASTQHIYTQTGPYTVSLTAISNKGCTSTITVPLTTIHPEPVAVITAPAATCISDSTILSGNTAGQWSWDFGDHTGTSNLQNPKYKWNAAGKYGVSLIITSSFGCQSAPAIDSITVNDLPVANYTAPITGLCAKSDISFTDASTTPANSTITEWHWDFGDGGTASTQNPTHKFATAGTYTVALWIKNSNGCISTTFSSPVTINPLPNPNFSVAPICLPADGSHGDGNFTDQSTISSGFISELTWDFGDGPGSGGTGSNPVHSYAIGGVYNVKLTATSGVGCSADTTIPVTVYNIPTALDSIVNDTALCSNVPVVLLNESIVNGYGNISKVELYWDYVNQNAAPDTTDNFPVANGSYTHQYPLSGVDKSYQVRINAYSGNGCPNTPHDTVIVVHASPFAQLTPFAPVCQEVAPFDLTGGSDLNNLPGIGTYSGDGIVTSPQFSPQVAGPGIHAITYTYTSTNGCMSDTVQSIEVYPTPAINYGGTQYVLENDSIVLNPVSVKGADLSYLWSPSIFLNSDTSATPTAKPSDDITYTISVTSPGGCHASDVLLVKVLRNFVVPNTFTPNDDGINDTWVIEELPYYPIQRVQIFDRYGQVIYETRHNYVPWDGKYKGKPLSAGTYYYIIELNGLRSPKTGYVTILR